jgi:hypothetical protein
MKKSVVMPILVFGVLLMSSFSVMANLENAPGQLKEKKEKNPDAPGQWKKTINYTNQSDFVFAVHFRIWNRLQMMNVSPPGLMRLIDMFIELTDVFFGESNDVEELPEVTIESDDLDEEDFPEEPEVPEE